MPRVKANSDGSLPEPGEMMVAQVTTFGTTADGRKVDAIHLTKGELRATILTYGARLQDLRLAGCQSHFRCHGND